MKYLILALALMPCTVAAQGIYFYERYERPEWLAAPAPPNDNLGATQMLLNQMNRIGDVQRQNRQIDLQQQYQNRWFDLQQQRIDQQATETCYGFGALRECF